MYKGSGAEYLPAPGIESALRNMSLSASEIISCLGNA